MCELITNDPRTYTTRHEFRSLMSFRVISWIVFPLRLVGVRAPSRLLLAVKGFVSEVDNLCAVAAFTYVAFDGIDEDIQAFGRFSLDR